MKQHAPSCDRNQDHILEVLTEVLPAKGKVLEIGSGTGQHVAYFSQVFPDLTWQPTDLAENLASIQAWCLEATAGNVLPAQVLDLSKGNWPQDKFDAVICINTIHIVAWPLVESLFLGAGRLLNPGGVMYTYGPYRYKSKSLEPSNADFDAWLKKRDPYSGIRYFEDVNQLASANGLRFQSDLEMPANNRSLIWIKNRN